MEKSDKNTLLFKALASLSQKKPFHDISISVLCQQAGVSRMYFYRHFNTLDEIIAQHINDDFRRFVRLIDHRRIKNSAIFIETFLQVLEPDLPELAIFLKNDRANLIQTIFQNDLAELIKVDTLPFPKVHNPYWQVYVAGGLTRVLVTWFEQAHPESPKQMGQLITQIVNKP
ncbi:TetR/AcrR family transcriptional regulator [Levilactobacillus acidifarinae]|uniref:HTH tetR-type domain-containing protein n=1 Tax=Levilactobacillus acidifarinae DSM 19394 = JCM 15949 TaxID=1423715 RepID=A0A0R1LG35_9LACO|nr:TetR/AcrR family transcriptional regulator [Levilactobacillus acidifarinae]KRK94448.1 hypothetical protein FD25_GL000410 [Levilactobacillus acidifarinae DSM 19394]GEO68191.1 TetR family transcriptional regulator [Levilactobacillus acidifarinae]